MIICDTERIYHFEYCMNIMICGRMFFAGRMLDYKKKLEELGRAFRNEVHSSHREQKAIDRRRTGFSSLVGAKTLK